MVSKLALVYYDLRIEVKVRLEFTGAIFCLNPVRGLDKQLKRYHANCMNIRVFILLLFPFYSHSQDASLFEISAQIKSNKNFQGQIVCSLYRDAKQYPSAKLPEIDIIKLPLKDLTQDNINCVYKDIKPGKYAVTVFHDLNNNGKLDTNDLGFPIEPYGFSNNASNRAFGPPTFKDIQINIRNASKKLIINLN